MISKQKNLKKYLQVSLIIEKICEHIASVDNDNIRILGTKK
jgi:hypothetical protein